MDNEASTALKNEIKTMDIKYQLSPRSNQRSKNEEISIQTFNIHFISGLGSMDSDPHLQLWDRIIQQAKINLKLLQKSRLHPQMLAYKYLHG